MRASALQKIENAGGDVASRPRVLYAEDQQTSRIVTTALLRRIGYDVTAVEDGELAVAEARRDKFDLILLDIEMPILDGVGAARAIRAEAAPNIGVPILALSAFLADSTENTNWRGVFDFALPKPTNQEELKRAIERVTQTTARRKLTREEILASLRNTLPKPVWIQVLASAYGEMKHLSNALVACRDAGDIAAVKRCATNLIGLAQSFEAHDVVQAATPHGDEEAKQPVTELLSVIDAWHAAAMSSAA
jgi:CheY-like chemotaxis protein